MKKKCCFMFLVLIICMTFGVVYGAENEITRKVVSVVYDDFYSVKKESNKENSNYILQMITSLLESDDKLSVVKMSEAYKSFEVDLENQERKQTFIDEVKDYQSVINTQFEGMNTAREWLVNEASYNEDTAKYWLVVIANGSFKDKSKELEKYLKDIEFDFRDFEFEILFLDLSDLQDTAIKDAVENSKNSKYMTINTEQDTYDSVFEIAKVFNINVNNQLVYINKENDSVIKVNAKYPLKKLSIVIQDCNNEVKFVTHNSSEVNLENHYIYSTDNSLVGSVTNVINNAVNYLDAGEYEIEFRGSVEEDKILILHESYFRPKICFVDERDNLLSPEDHWIHLTATDRIKVKCELYSAFDDSKLPYCEENKNFDVDVLIEERRYSLKFDENKNAYYGYVPLENPGNIMYALVEKGENFSLKSNILAVNVYASPEEVPSQDEFFLDSAEMIKMEIPYSNSEKYIFRNKFLPKCEGGDEYGSESIYYQIQNIPDGVIFEFAGKRYRSDEKIPADFKKGKIHEISIYSNKDYIERDAQEMIVFISYANGLFFPIYWVNTGNDKLPFCIVPHTLPIKVKLDKTNEEVYVTYSSKNEDRYISEYSFSIEETDEDSEMPQFFEIQLLNVPVGIIIEHDGRKYTDNEDIPIIVEKGRIYTLKIYANDEYVEIDKKSIILKLKSDVFEQELSWSTTGNTEESIVIVPEVYPIKVTEIETTDKIFSSYSFSGDEKNIFRYTFMIEEDNAKNSGEKFEIHLFDMPEGISFEYDGKRYKNNDKIPIIIKYNEIYEVNVLANSEYRETEERNVILKLQSILPSQEISLNGKGNTEKVITICPKNNPIHVFNKGTEKIDIQKEFLELEIARVDDIQSLNVIENVSLKNIKSIEDNSSLFSGFTYKIEKDVENDVLKIKFKPNLFCLVKDDKVNVEIKMEFDNDFETAMFVQEIDIENINIMVVLKPCIVAFEILLFIMGYIVKRKFDPDAQIVITEDGDCMAYGLTPSLISVVIPYMAHRTKVGVVNFKASKNKELICSTNEFEILKVNDEPFVEYRKKQGIDNKKFVMRKGKSSFVIKAYDSMQRYEYLDSGNGTTDKEYKLDEIYLEDDQN